MRRSVMDRSGLKERFIRALEHPATHSLSIDSSETTVLRWQIIREKLFLRGIYDEWYRAVAAAIPRGAEPALELGSGAGFMSDYVENLITSDILALPGLDRVIDACASLPFEDGSLRGIAMVNTLHHLPDVEVFVTEAVRCLQPGGVVSMIEPWNTRWSRFVYTRLHHETFEPDAPCWQFEPGGPLSGANGALPWILMVRDRERFEHRFPQLRIVEPRLTMPIRYLLSGGVSMRALVPSWSFLPLRAVEEACRPCMSAVAMFAHIVLIRR
jgi:SAM-dependent methyltransferase